MKTLISAGILVVTLFGSAGCVSVVSSAAPGLSVATGEMWYTRDNTFLGIPLGSEIYYCPAGSNTCYEAEIK